MPAARLWNSFLPNSCVAVSKPMKGILFAFRMVSMREVAVMMWEEPAVKEVNR